MKKIAFLIILAIGLISFNSCSDDDDITPDEIENPEDPGDTEDGELNNNSQNVNYENAVYLAFASNGVVIDNEFENNGVDIENNDNHVVIRSSLTNAEINIVLSGSTTNGSVKVYGDASFGLILNGIGITNPNGAAINIQSKETALVEIIDETNNRLIDGAEYLSTEGEDMKSTFFSEGDIEISGNGSLEIRGKNRHALCSDGSLTIHNGNINIKEATSDGLHANDDISINGGYLTIRSAGDGIDTGEEIRITGGEINIITTGEKSDAIKTDENIYIDTNSPIEITVYGNAAKGIKPTGDLRIIKGEITINTAGDAIWDEEDQDISSAAAIKCDGNMLMENGDLTILSTGSGGKGINVDGTITINDGTINVTTTGNQFVYDRDNDTAAKAIKSDGNLTVNGGTITIRTSQTEAEGLESKATLTITGGNINIEAHDDCINATNHIQIEGGTIYCSSATNDGIDSNGTLTITGGLVIADGGEGGIDCDRNRFSMTGGTLIGLGNMQSTPTANASQQRTLVWNRSSASSIQTIRIQAVSDGSEVLTLRLPRTYSRFGLVLSLPSFAGNTEYAIYTGGSISNGTDFYGYYTGASYSGGTVMETFTTGADSGAVTTIGSSGGWW